MADAFAFRLHEVDERVLFAIDADLHQLKEVAGCLALDPEFIAGCAPEGRDACLNALLKGSLFGPF